MTLPVPITPTHLIPLAEPAAELRAPKEIPAVLEMNDPAVKLDIAGVLAANQLTCTLRDAPEWLDFQNGVLSLKSGTDFDRIDFGGYDLSLVLAAKSGPFAGCVAEHTLKVRIPVPEVRMRIAGDPPTITTWVNGVKILQHREPKSVHPARGHIGLQIHGGARSKGTVRYRNVRAHSV